MIVLEWEVICCLTTFDATVREAAVTCQTNNNSEVDVTTLLGLLHPYANNCNWNKQRI